MAIDTGPLLEALDPPVFTHEGQSFHGRHLSILEWARFLGRVSRLGAKKLSLIEQQRLYRDLVNAWFPKPRRRWFGKRERTVGDIVLTLPPAVQDQVIAGFMRSQLRALGRTAPTVGSISPAPMTTA